MKTNIWKLISIVLVFAIMFEIYLISNNDVEIRDFKIPKYQLKEIYESLPNENVFIICDIEENQCIQLAKTLN